MGIIHRGQWDGNKWQSSPSQGKVHLNALATQGHCSDRPYKIKVRPPAYRRFSFGPKTPFTCILRKANLAMENHPVIEWLYMIVPLPINIWVIYWLYKVIRIYIYEFSHPLYLIFPFQTPFIGDVPLPMFDYYRGYWGWKSCYFLYIGIFRQTLPTSEDFKKCQPGFINLTLFHWISLGCSNFNTNLLLIEG